MLWINCPFCNLINKRHADVPKSLQVSGIETLFQELIYIGKYFVVKPDISPVTPFHLLIIPIAHYFSFLNIPDEKEQELDIIKHRVDRLYKKKLGKELIFFEHGSCGDTKGSSCVNHAHLHCVPLDRKSVSEVINYAFRTLGSSVNSKSLKSSNYLFLQSANRELNYWIDQNKSQIFRKIIAEVIGNIHRANWQSCLLYPEQFHLTKIWLDEITPIKL